MLISRFSEAHLNKIQLDMMQYGSPAMTLSVQIHINLMHIVFRQNDHILSLYLEVIS